MATITERKNRDGSIAYTAQIRLKKKGVVFHQETRSFPKRKLAEQWSIRREDELRTADGLAAATRAPATFIDLLDRFERERGLLRRKNRDSEMIKLRKWPIATKNAYALTAIDYVEHARNRVESGAQPQTVLNDLSILRRLAVLATALWNAPVDVSALDDAKRRLKSLGLIGNARPRTRRPTPDELDRLFAHYAAMDRRAKIPMVEILRFALATARRVDEICRIRWDDLNLPKRTGILRDVKHPISKEGNDMEFRLTTEAIEIIERQPRIAVEVFPYNSRSVSNSFVTACAVLGIDDLHFHDLRHEAVSRLFERGYSIPEVAKFSLHTSWKTLSQYTHLKAEDIVEK